MTERSRDERKRAEKFKELLEDADFRYGHDVFLASDGRFVNARGDSIDPYTILRKIGGLIDAVKRGRDMLSVLMATVEQREMELAQKTAPKETDCK
jgi:hypothetical protein